MRLRSVTLVSGLLVALSAVPGNAESASFAILKSKDIKIYNEAAVGFKTNCSGTFLEYDMNEDFERGAEHAAEINAKEPSAVLSLGTRAAMAAKRFIDDDIPVVFSLVLDPGKADIEASNITGVKMEIPIRTQLEALKSIIPEVDKIGVMYNPKRSREMVRDAASVAKSMGIQLIASRIERKEDAVRALSAFAGGIDAFWLIADRTVANKSVFPKLLKFTIENKIPFFAFSEAFVRARALFSLSADYSGIGAQACDIAKELAGGKGPAEIPWQDPEGLKLSINITTAQQLGFDKISANAFSYAAGQNYQIQPIQ